MDCWQDNVNEKVFNAYMQFFINDAVNFWEFRIFFLLFFSNLKNIGVSSKVERSKGVNDESFNTQLLLQKLVCCFWKYLGIVNIWNMNGVDLT